MYIGPGSESMVAAAEAWEGLASELYTTANSYQSVIAGLTAGPWIGPSSASMTAAAASFVSWLKSAATQAEEAATQAEAAAAAYEEAFASTVPPPLVAANRTRLTRLVATNLFGQNTSAIATTEARYAEMWAQDTAAMYRYAGSSAPSTEHHPGRVGRASGRGCPGDRHIRRPGAELRCIGAANVVRGTHRAAEPGSGRPVEFCLEHPRNVERPGFDLVRPAVRRRRAYRRRTAERPRHSVHPFGHRRLRHRCPHRRHRQSLERRTAVARHRASTRQRVPGASHQPAPGHGAVAHSLGRPGRGERGREFVRAVDLDHRHAGGTPDLVHVARVACRRRHRRSGFHARVEYHVRPDGSGGYGGAGHRRHPGHRCRQGRRQSSEGRTRAGRRRRRQDGGRCGGGRFRRSAAEQPPGGYHRSRGRASRVHQAPRRGNSDRRRVHRAEEPPARSLNHPPPCGGRWLPGR